MSTASPSKEYPNTKINLIQWVSKGISLIVHPLWWPTFGLYSLLSLNPYLFGVAKPQERITLILQVFVLTFILPVFSIFLLKKLNFLNSWSMDERSERIGPYLITLICYMWLYINIRHDPKVPLVYNIFVFGALITLILVFMFNLFIKISAHTAVMGGLLAMTWITFNVFSHENFTLFIPGQGPVLFSWRSVLITVMVLGGIVGSARMQLKAHTSKEIYFGYAIGLIAQWSAFKILF
ncbi:MAG: hypothetical protein ABIR66_06525 [Saprospiraceae bacterium]